MHTAAVKDIFAPIVLSKAIIVTKRHYSDNIVDSILHVIRDMRSCVNVYVTQNAD